MSHSARFLRPQLQSTPHLDFCLSFSLTVAHIVVPHTTSLPQLHTFFVFVSVSLFDPAWQINCSRPMLSGLRGGPSRGILVLLGFQPYTMVMIYSPVTGRHLRVSPGHLHWLSPSTPSPSTIATSQMPHTNNVGRNASTQTSVLSLDAYTHILAQLHSASGCIYSGGSTQCCFQKCLHTTPAHRVFSWVHLLQRPFGSRGPSSYPWECQWRLTSPTEGHRRYQQFQHQRQQWPRSSPRALPDCTPPPPPGLEGQALLGMSRNIPSTAVLVRPHSHLGPSRTSQSVLTPPTSPPTSQPQVSTTHVGTHTLALQLPTKEVLMPPKREPTLPSVLIHVPAVVHSRSPGLLYCPWYALDCSNLMGTATSTTQTVILCTIDIVSLFQS